MLSPAAAQDTPSPAYTSAYERMLEAPTDTEVAFEFAEIAVSEGDLYAAIGALERIVRLDPDRPDIQIRLGELYRMVGATTLAQAYLEAGLQSPSVPPEIRRRAEELLTRAGDETDQAASRHRLFGIASVGGRYETNANAGPDTLIVRAGGGDAFLDGESQEQADWSLAFSGDINHQYLIDSQNGDRLETNLVGFVSRYADVLTSNTTLGEIDSGPRFFFGDINQFSVRPFAEATYLALNDATYRGEIGGGVNGRYIARPDLLFDATFRWVAQDYKDTVDQPLGSFRNGSDLSIRPGITYEIGPQTIISGDLLFGNKTAEFDFEAFRDLGLGMSVTHVFEGQQIDGWSLTGNAFFRRSAYRDPDPFVDPNMTRRDNRYDASLGLSIPVIDDLSLALRARYTNNDSNIPNYEFDNTTLSVLTSYVF